MSANDDELPPQSRPRYDNLITEGGKPGDSVYADKQARLLEDPLESSWNGPREGEKCSLVTMSNVGVFLSDSRPGVVPHFLLSLDADYPTDIHRKDHRSYFCWVYGQPPDVVVEIVSDRRGGEEDHKMKEYAWLRVWYYIIYDPDKYLGQEVLRVYTLGPAGYRLVLDNRLSSLGLSLVLWTGTWAGIHAEWLRWVDREGRLIPTSAERAEQEKQRGDAMAEQVRRLQAALRVAGLEPPA